MPALHLVIQAKATHPAVRADLYVRGAAWERPGAPGQHSAALFREGRQPPQSAMYTGKPALDGLTQVGQQMPPVGHLDCLGRADRDGSGILRRAVACDNLDPWPLPQPAGQRGRGSVGQEIDHAALLQINDDRAVAASLALRPVIDPDDAGRGLMRQGNSVEQAQHGVGADRHGQPGQQPRTRFAAQHSASPALSLDQPACALGEGRHQLRYAFSEGLAGTDCVTTVEPAHAQSDPNRTPK